MTGYLYIFLTIMFTVYGQLILKWRVNLYGQLPDDLSAKFYYLLKLILDPFILSGFFSAFVASIFWVGAMSRFDVSFAYPFMSAAFIIVLLLSVLIFKEPMTWHKVAGLVLIVSGIIVTSQSQ